MLGVEFGLRWPALLNQTLAQALHSRHYRFVDEPFYVITIGKVDDPRQAFFPVRRQAVFAIAADLHMMQQTDITMPLDDQGPPHPQHGDDHDDGKGQGRNDGHGLQRTQAACHQQYRGNHTFEDGPERPL